MVRRKRKLVHEKEGCKSSKVLERFLKNVEDSNEVNEELVAHEGNYDTDIENALIG